MTEVDDNDEIKGGFGEKAVVGYTDSWSVQRGDDLPFMVSCDADEYDVAIVKLLCGDINPDGPGYAEEIIDTPVNGSHSGRTRDIHPGSHVLVPHDELQLTDSFTLHAYIYPTTPDNGRQGILTSWNAEHENGYGLFIDDEGYLSLWTSGVERSVDRVRTDLPLRTSTWHSVAATYDASDQQLRLAHHQFPDRDHELDDPDKPRGATARIPVDYSVLTPSGQPFVIAGYSTVNEEIVSGHYNGKIDRPTVVDRALSLDELKAVTAGTDDRISSPLAAWDFSEGLDDNGLPRPSEIIDTGPHGFHGRAVNLPARGVPGFDWTGTVHDFKQDPAQYGAIHFHDDDLIDAGWDPDFELTIPEDMDSAVYAARLRADGDEYYVPFFVRPKQGTSTADLAFLAPTNSYLAYANKRAKIEGVLGSSYDRYHDNHENHSGMVPIFSEDEVFLSRHREYGLSLYDTHTDGHGSMFSSRLRPIINMSPKFIWGSAPPSHIHQLNADLYLVDWLEEHDYDYDVITDEDLHLEGVDLLDQYNAVITGHHAEYYSGEQLDAIETYQRDGGRFINISGNGFVWAITYHPSNPQVIETRRAESATQSWTAKPGELYHAFTGEKGGLWMKRGRPPQKLAGVGFSAQWDPQGTYYRRLSDSYESETAFIFEGIDEEKIGDFGLLTGGAAGAEIDWYDSALGSPDHAYILATSEGHTEYERQVTEELTATEPYLDARMNPRARADMVYYRTPNDGAVFSTGSMAWVGSLSHNNYDNNVSRILANVVNAFVSDQSLSSN